MNTATRNVALVLLAGTLLEASSEFGPVEISPGCWRCHLRRAGVVVA